MATTRRTLFAALTLLAVVLIPAALAAQAHDMGGDGASTFGEDFPHGVTFWTRREPEGCTLCAPAIDINAGRYERSGDVGSDISETFVRLHTQFGTGIRHIAIAADITWLPGRYQVTPSHYIFVAQYEPISQQKRLYGHLGLGVISDRDQSGGNAFSPWAQATVAYRSKIHDLAPFVMAGRVLNGDNRKFEFTFGVAHPLAPYRMHMP